MRLKINARLCELPLEPSKIRKIVHWFVCFFVFLFFVFCFAFFFFLYKAYNFSQKVLEELYVMTLEGDAKPIKI